MIEVVTAAVGAAVAAYNAAELAADWAERSCVIEIMNMTPERFELSRSGTSSGEFVAGHLPSVIQPFEAAIVKAASTVVSQGAVGNLGFQGRDVGIRLDFSNPFAGGNDLDVSSNGPRAVEFLLEAYAGPGNKNAHLRCAIAQQFQDEWRFCPKCHLVFAGETGSHCPAGGAHEPAGWTFLMFHDLPDGPRLQAGWRFCPRCHGLFWPPSAADACAGGGSHDPVGWQYNVVMGLGETAGLQTNWRFCNRCSGLFWAGSDEASHRCQAGGTHHVGSTAYGLLHKK